MKQSRYICVIVQIACFLLTSYGLAFARGQGGTDVASQMQICVGLQVVTVHVGPDGTPVSGLHLCPDAGNALLTDPGLPREFVTAHFATFSAVLPGKIFSTISVRTPTPQARGPPALV